MSLLSKNEYEAARADAELNPEYAIAGFPEGFDSGFEYALRLFGIWKDGAQTIGCLETPVNEILKDVGIEP